MRPLALSHKTLRPSQWYEGWPMSTISLHCSFNSLFPHLLLPHTETTQSPEQTPNYEMSVPICSSGRGRVVWHSAKKRGCWRTHIVFWTRVNVSLKNSRQWKEITLVITNLLYHHFQDFYIIKNLLCCPLYQICLFASLIRHTVQQRFEWTLA